MSAYEEDRNQELGIESTDVDKSLTQYFYNGETFDEFTGQQYLRTRCYCPPSGQFAGLDPFAKPDNKDDD